MKDLYIIKDRLNEALKYRDMTPKQLAERSGLHFTAIYRYLKGERIPKTDTIDLMANTLNVSPSWLLGYDVPMLLNDSTIKPDFTIKTEEDSFTLEIKRLSSKMTEEQKQKAISIIEYVISKGKEDSKDDNSEV